MSKYYKVEDVIRAIEEMHHCYNGWSDTYDKAQIIGVLEELPTIEVSEDCISKATVLEIYSDLYWIDERLLNFKSELDKVYDELRNAPSVVPTQTNTNQCVQRAEYVGDIEKKRCRTCKHFKCEFYTPISSDGTYYTYVICTEKECHYEAVDTPQTDIHGLTDCDFCKGENCEDCEGGKDEPQTEREGE